MAIQFNKPPLKPGPTIEEKRARKAAREEVKVQAFEMATEQSDYVGPREQIAIKMPTEVIEYFKKDGPGYQTRIVDVLVAYVAWAKVMEERSE